jgi:hypothetical protein
MRNSLWAMLERLMSVSDIVEEVYLILPSKKCRTYAVYGRVTPALVIEATLFVEVLEELGVGFAPPEVHVGDLEITPEMATIV